ncbi:MAG: ABC transporter permease subunit [Clostridia bacterium]|nr:ABC transporter permease subunit [Clostridia bacterium]MBR5947460.1 ABC transporter permease subunit [Clostridia bacterium]
MASALKKTLKAILVAAFWLAVWQTAAYFVGSELLLPTPFSVIKTLFKLIGTHKFRISAANTLIRVVAGFTLGLFAGTLLGCLTAASKLLALLLSPLRSIIKATPVTSFIVLLLLYLSPVITPVAVSVLMVIPIAWTNVAKGITETDADLLEMAKVFRLGRLKTVRSIYIPSVLPHFLTAATTGFGFAWKSCVAAEVIAMSKLSIGIGLYESKLYLETPELFAWTAAIIIISMLLEAVLVKLIERLKKW